MTIRKSVMISVVAGNLLIIDNRAWLVCADELCIISSLYLRLKPQDFIALLLLGDSRSWFLTLCSPNGGRFSDSANLGAGLFSGLSLSIILIIGQSPDY